MRIHKYFLRAHKTKLISNSTRGGYFLAPVVEVKFPIFLAQYILNSSHCCKEAKCLNGSLGSIQSSFIFLCVSYFFESGDNCAEFFLGNKVQRQKVCH